MIRGEEGETKAHLDNFSRSFFWFLFSDSFPFDSLFVYMHVSF